MLQKLLVQTYHFLSGKEKDASHISMTHAFLCTYLLYCELCKKVPIYSCNSLRTAYPFRT
jgi:hypothetical protein